MTEEAERAARTRRESGPKGQRARVAQETLDSLAAGGYTSTSGQWIDLTDHMHEAIKASAVFLETDKHVHRLPEACFRGQTTVQVLCTTTLAAASQLATSSTASRTGILNFASARNPGGGFSTGAQAQEESIARASGIYPCLTKYMQEVFIPNRKRSSGPYTHDMIYSPNVPVFRDDDGWFLDTPYSVDFVTSAAPNVGVMKKAMGSAQAETKAAELLAERSKRILELFASNQAVDLVLGAWGCGVFQNDPATVAKIFKQHLNGKFAGVFRSVVFAVLQPDMAAVFADVFGTRMQSNVTPPTSSKQAPVREGSSANKSTETSSSGGYAQEVKQNVPSSLEGYVQESDSNMTWPTLSHASAKGVDKERKSRWKKGKSGDGAASSCSVGGQ